MSSEVNQPRESAGSFGPGGPNRATLQIWPFLENWTSVPVLMDEKNDLISGVQWELGSKPSLDRQSKH